jgi:uncharacterized protein YjbJ (UPF0337 family)
MSGTTDKIKGRVKEAAGVVTGDERLRSEGRLDQAVGKAKKVAEHEIDKAKGNRSSRDESLLWSRPHLRPTQGCRRFTL